MEDNLVIIVIAVTFLLIGFLWGKNKQREESFKETDRALQGQRASIKGKVAEHIAPLLPSFEEQFPSLNIADARFVGEPIDYVFFEGMSQGRIEKVLFLEVKSGRHPRLNGHEESLRAVIKDAERKGANVGWREYQVPDRP